MAKVAKMAASTEVPGKTVMRRGIQYLTAGNVADFVDTNNTQPKVEHATCNKQRTTLRSATMHHAACSSHHAGTRCNNVADFH